MSKKSGLAQWAEERYDVEQIKDLIDKQLYKPLPKHVTWFHTFGSISLFLFVSQVLTGILLLFYYRPTIGEAFESVKYIMTTPYMGWLYRQIHAWGANLMVIFVFLHMLRTFVTGSYKKPREITWITGVFLFLLTLVFGFTGYLLPWNQLAYWATTVGTEVAGAVPFVGEAIKTLMRGGESVGNETLSRFFVVHVIVLPWIVFFLIAFHLFLMRFQGLATLKPVGSDEKSEVSRNNLFFPHHVMKEGIVLFVLIAVLISLSVYFPFELGEKANSLQTPHAIKPEWYFLPMYQVLKFFPKLIGIFVAGLAPLLLVLWPFLDKTRERTPLKRPISMTIGALALFSFLLLGAMGYLSETKREFFGKTYEFDIYGLPSQVMEEKEDNVGGE